MLKARLHPHWVGGKAGYLYSVLLDGKLLVERSRDQQFDAARALLAQGFTGKLTLLDGKTGKPRIMIDIEKGAKLTVKEGPLRFVPYEENRPDRGDSSVIASLVAEAGEKRNTALREDAA